MRRKLKIDTYFVYIFLLYYNIAIIVWGEDVFTRKDSGIVSE